MRLLKEPIEIYQILVTIKTLSAKARVTIEFAQLFAATNKAAITLLHISDRKTPETEVSALENENTDIAIKIVRNDKTTEAILDRKKTTI